MFWNRIQMTGSPRKTPRMRQSAAAQALFVQTCAAKEAAGWLE